MEDYVILEHSDKFDSIICSSLGDITCNGEKELVIGTYGKVSYFVENNMFLNSIFLCRWYLHIDFKLKKVRDWREEKWKSMRIP